MDENKRPEFSTGRGGDPRLPDGRPRPLTDRERAQALRRAGMRDEPLPPGVEPGTRVG